jgi:hypothetical protein
LSVIEQKIFKILKDYKMADKTSPKSEKGLINAIIEILEFSFFLYSVSPRVNITIRLCRILRRVTEFLKCKGNVNNVDHKHLVFKCIYDNISFILRKNKASEDTQVETLQLLIALAEIGKEYWLDDSVLRRYFGISEDCGKLEITRTLNYYSITVLLFYMKNKKRYDTLRLCLQDHILKKFNKIPKQDRGKYTELVLLLFDVLACPNLPDDFKCELLSANGVSDKNLQLDILKKEENWFTRWTDFDFGDALDAKRSRDVY